MIVDYHKCKYINDLDTMIRLGTSQRYRNLKKKESKIYSDDSIFLTQRGIII
jgi:hypothetical protein